ncbi:MAG: hypothetical protein AAF862_03060 [Pseudomonadota bacterium]
MTAAGAMPKHLAGCYPQGTLKRPLGLGDFAPVTAPTQINAAILSVLEYTHQSSQAA